MTSNELKRRAKDVRETDCEFFMIFDYVEPGTEKSTKSVIRYIEEHPKGFTTDALHDLLRHVPISLMLEEWLGTIKKPETKRKYTKAIEHIFSLQPLSDLLKKHGAITSLDKNWAGTNGVYRLIEDLDVHEQMITVCLRVYSSFCDFVRARTLGVVDPEESPKQRLEYYSVKLIYEEIDWVGFINSLENPFNLIAEMTYLAAKECEYRLRVVHSTKNVLSLDSSQIRFRSNIIDFKAQQSYHVVDVIDSLYSIPFPNDFMRRLEKYLGNRTGTVFLSSKGKALFSIQIQRAFKRASRRLFHEITPVMVGWAGVLAFKKNQDNLFSKN